LKRAAAVFTLHGIHTAGAQTVFIALIARLAPAASEEAEAVEENDRVVNVIGAVAVIFKEAAVIAEAHAIIFMKIANIAEYAHAVVYKLIAAVTYAHANKLTAIFAAHAVKLKLIAAVAYAYTLKVEIMANITFVGIVNDDAAVA
jgi:hypothetical protein